MLNLHGLTLFIWIVSVLTLSVSDEVKTDGRMLLTSASNVSLIDAFSENDHRTLSSAIQPISESNNSTKTLNVCKNFFICQLTHLCNYQCSKIQCMI